MGYGKIWEKYKKNIVSMAAFVAWLWFFPLFGILQTALPESHGKMTVFNLTFLFATILGYLIFLCLRSRPILRFLVAFAAPTTAAFTWLTTFAAWRFPADIFLTWGALSVGMFVFFPAVMGAAAAIYFAFWGTTIFYVSPDKRGRYMGAMVAAATVFYVILVVVFYAAPLPSLFLAGLFLFIPSYFLKTVSCFVESSEKEATSRTVSFDAGVAVRKDFNPRKVFWLPFSLTILCFYILSWATHDIIFSVIKAESTFSPILGQAFYALVFVFAGFYLDREKEIEKMAVLGLIILGCAFLLLPVALAFGVLSPLYFLLEGSYGLIDLFMWVSLAYFCQLLGGDPKHYYAQGLLLNILFIISGIILMPLLDVYIEGVGYFVLSVAAGIILFFGMLPTLSLRKIRLASQEGTGLSDIMHREIGRLNNYGDFQMDVFTQKEKEVLYLMLAGFKNPEIVKSLGFSNNTLKTHVRHIYEKSGVKNRSELLFKFADLTKQSGS